MTQKDLNAMQQLMCSQHVLQLGTWSLRHPGYPYVSLCTYIMGQDGLPTVLIASIAEHTLHLQNDPRCSFMVGSADQQLESPRISWQAQARRVEDERRSVISARFDRYFPEMQMYHQQLNFDFYTLCPLEGRWIGGFGRALWMPWPSGVWIPEPTEEEVLLAWLSEKGITHAIGFDCWGLDLRRQGQVQRVAWEVPVGSISALKQQLSDNFLDNLVHLS